LNNAARGRVLFVTPGNTALEVALGTSRARRLGDIQFKTPDVLTTEDYKKDADSGAYNLIVYDQCAPTTMPRSNTLFVGRLQPTKAWHKSDDASGMDAKEAKDEKAKDALTEEPEDRLVVAPQILDWDR